MLGRYLVLSALLLVGIPLAGAAGDQVEGLLEAEGTVSLVGDAESTVPDPVLWMDAPDATQSAPLTFEAQSATVTYKELTIETVHAETPLTEYRFALPQQVETEERTHEDVSVTLSSFGPETQVFVEPGAKGLVAKMETLDSTSNLGGLPEGLRVVDGYTDMFEEDDADTDPEFHYENRIDRGLTWFNQPSNLTVQGSMHNYIWDTTIKVHNETSTFQTYTTGREEQTNHDGQQKKVRFSYVLLELEGVTFNWTDPSSGLKVLAPGINLDLEGSMHMDNPHGTLTSTDGLYRAAGLQKATLEGAFSIDARPGTTPATGPTVTLGLEGPVEGTNIPLIEDQEGLTTSSVVAGAGGLTVLGIALWYVVSGKVAALSLIGAVRSPKKQAIPVGASEIEDPQELLHDPDRFTLYHLIRSRIGLSAEDCASLTGIEDAGQHLDILAAYGLLSTLEGAPDRYMVPGHVEPERQERIALLREPGAKRLASLLAVSGLTPERTLLERVQAIEDPIPIKQTTQLLDRFEKRGLVYREPSEGGRVVDPTTTLLDCLERMGTGHI